MPVPLDLSVHQNFRRGAGSGWTGPSGRRVARWLSTLLALAMLFPHLTWAFEGATFSAPVPGLQSKRVQELPEELGTVVRHLSGRGPIVFVVQDLHCQYQVQSRIESLIAYLVQKHALRLVAIEGASRTVNVTKLSTFPDADVRRQVCENLMRRGRLSGAEAYAVTAERPVRLQGVEDPDLYRQDRERLLAFVNEESAGLVDDLRQSLGRLKAELYPFELQKFDGLRTGFETGGLSALQYARALQRSALQARLTLTEYPTLQAYLAAGRLDLAAGLDTDDLLRELQALEARVRETLYTAPVQRTFDDLWERLGLLDHLLTASLSVPELERARRDPAAIGVRAFTDFLRRYDPGGETPDPAVDKLDRFRDLALDFYRIADLRSQAFVTRTLDAMRGQQAGAAVLICGGYHTPVVLAGLRAAGVAAVVIKPRQGQLDAANPYYTLLLESRSPLERLLSQGARSFALAPLFAETNEPAAAETAAAPLVDESRLPEATALAYQELEGLAKGALACALWTAGDRDLEHFRTAFQAKLTPSFATAAAPAWPGWPANAHRVELDLARAEIAGDSLVVPLRGAPGFLVVSSWAAAAHLPSALETLTVDGREARFYPNPMRRGVVALLNEAGNGRHVAFDQARASAWMRTAFRVLPGVPSVLAAATQVRHWGLPRMAATARSGDQPGLSAANVAALAGLAKLRSAAAATLERGRTAGVDLDAVNQDLIHSTRAMLAQDGNALQTAPVGPPRSAPAARAAPEIPRLPASRSLGTPHPARARFMFLPVFTAILSDLKLAIGILPILAHMSLGHPTLAWTLGAVAVVLVILAVSTWLANLALAMTREKRLYSFREIGQSLRAEVNAFINSFRRWFQEFRDQKKNAPTTTVLAVLLVVGARAFEYATLLGFLGTMGAIVPYILLGVFLLLTGVSLLRSPNKTEWLETLVSRSLRLILAVILVDVVRLPALFFAVGYITSAPLATQLSQVSLRMFKKIFGALSLAEILLSIGNWFRRGVRHDPVEKRSLPKALGHAFAKIAAKFRNGFSPNAPLRQALVLVLAASVLLVAFQLALPPLAFLALQIGVNLVLVLQWAAMSRNPKVSHKVKILVLAGMLPSLLLGLFSAAGFAALGANLLWPHLLPGLIGSWLPAVAQFLTFIHTEMLEATLFVGFIYPLWGFSRVLRDQDAYRKVADAAPDQIQALDGLVNRMLQQAAECLRPDDTVRPEQLRPLYETKSIRLVPKRYQPEWIQEGFTDTFNDGVYTYLGDTYFDERLFKVVSNPIRAALAVRERLFELGMLPEARVNEMVEAVSGLDMTAVDALVQRVFDAPDLAAAYQVALESDPGRSSLAGAARASFQRHSLERMYGLTFPVAEGVYETLFAGNWLLLNRKVQLCQRLKLVPHPYLLRYGSDRIKLAGDYLSARQRPGQPMPLKLIREALEATRPGHSSQPAPAVVPEALQQTAIRTFAEQGGFQTGALRFMPLHALQVRGRIPDGFVGRYLLDRQVPTLYLPNALYHDLIRWTPGAPQRPGIGERVRSRIYRVWLYGILAWHAAAYEIDRPGPGAGTMPEDPAADPGLAAVRPDGAVPALAAWQDVRSHLRADISRPLRPQRIALQRFWQSLMLLLFFTPLDPAADTRGLSQPWVGLLGLFRWPVQTARLLLHGAAAGSDRTPVAVDDGNGRLVQLLRQSGLPDVWALQASRSRLGYEVPPLLLRPLTPARGSALARLREAWTLGRYVEDGENGRPTLYVRGSLLAAVQAGLPARSQGLRGRWQRLQFLAATWLLGLILEREGRPGYYAQSGPEQAVAASRAYLAWQHDADRALTPQMALAAGTPVLEAYQTPAAKQGLSTFDLFQLTDRALAAVSPQTSRSGTMAADPLAAALAQRHWQGATPDLATVLDLIAELPATTTDPVLADLGQALRESRTLPTEVRDRVRNDLAAYWLRSRATATALRPVSADTVPALVPEEIHLFALPGTCRALRERIDAAVAEFRPAGSAFQRLQVLRAALFAGEQAQAGSWVKLAPEIGTELWSAAVDQARSEDPVWRGLGTDLDEERGALTTGRVAVEPLQGLPVIARLVYDWSAPQSSVDVAEKLSAYARGRVQLFSGAILGEALVPERALGSVGRGLLRMSLTLPGALGRTAERFWRRQFPAAWLGRTAARTASPLSALLADPHSPMTRSFLAWQAQPTVTRERDWVRSLLRGLAEISDPVERRRAVDTVTTLCQALPELNAVPLGHWFDPGARDEDRILAPGFLLQPGQGGLLGIYLDGLRSLPAVLEWHDAEKRRRLNFKDSDNAA